MNQKGTIMTQQKKADICLFLEGTYPYVAGGVSNWTHELIKMQNHLTFHIVALVGGKSCNDLRFELPKNVVGFDTIYLQQLPKGNATLSAKQENVLFRTIKKPLLNLQQEGNLNDLKTIIQTIKPFKDKLGYQILFNSYPAWELLVSMYNITMKDSAFLDYFWSWRALFGGLYSVLFAPLPEADIYHALCTGYAGLFLARAKIETGKPCLVTEHGIYTNERRIEIASADWLEDQKALSMVINKKHINRELKDFWIDTFGNYSRLCYQVCSHIVTLYEGNQAFQIMDGADPGKLKIISNGIDYEHFSSIQKHYPHPPTIALIGRIVPIKDVKTFIKSVGILQKSLPDIRAFIMGPTEEDPQYYQECIEIIDYAGLEKYVVFTGKVNIEEYLGYIDVIVLTSISEAQPLVILEAGAAAIPTVATDVGACYEMIMGRQDEYPALGKGGAITPLSNAKAVANELLLLFSDKEHYQQCSTAIQNRVRCYYNKNQQYKSYSELYALMKNSLVMGDDKWQE